MLFRYDLSGKIEEMYPKYYPSPLGLITVYQVGNELLIETPQLFGELQKQMTEKHVPAVLKMLGLPVAETPKKEKR